MSSSRYRALLLDVMSTLVYEPFFKEVPSFFGMSLTDLIPLLKKGAWVDFELKNCLKTLVQCKGHRCIG